MIEFEVWGERALFSDPVIGMGGGKITLPVPTYEALKGILSAVYWKPTFIWVIDKVRVMNRIRTESMSVVTRKFGAAGCELSVNVYLCDVRYKVRAHFIWNGNRPEYEADRIEAMHYSRAIRMLSHGGARPAFLGKSDCPCYVAPCEFSEGRGYYDNTEVDFGIMHHGFTYADEAYSTETQNALNARVFRCCMNKGIIDFPPPEQCIHRFIKEMPIRRWDDINALV